MSAAERTAPGTDTIRIGPAAVGDAGEILTVQRAAYVLEAQLYRDPLIPPLTETLAAVRAAITRHLVLVARDGRRLVGAVRAEVDGATGRIGRLCVAPDVQGAGVGSRLLAAVEDAMPAGVRHLALFTGENSAANLRLYARRGYVETHRAPATTTFSFVYLRKDLAGAPVVRAQTTTPRGGARSQVG